MAQETKVIYHVDEETTPYLVKVGVAPTEVTLADLKSVLRSKGNYKYFFKSKDQDFGVVKEEITDDASPLPLFSGKVVCYLELAQGSTVGGHSSAGDIGSQVGRGSSVASDSVALPPPGLERGPGVGETRPPSFRGGVNNKDDLTGTETESMISSQPEAGEEFFDDTESSITSVSQAAAGRRQMESIMRNGAFPTNGARSNKPARLPGPGIRPPTFSLPSNNETSSMMSSEIESSIYDTEDNQSMASSRFTSSTDHTSVSQQMLRHKQKRKSKRRVPAHLARAGSISSVTDSTMSLNCITVTLNMDTVSFLGISIVGQSNKFGDGGDCGIYVGSIMKGGAVALDGRIQPGDMILQVNDISFESMTNDDAVKVLREVVQKPGPIKLVVAKCWDPPPSKGYLTIPRAEPVRPIDPGAWVAHTAAVRGLAIPSSAESFIDGPYLGTSRDRLLGDLQHVGPSHFQPQISSKGDYPGRCPSATTSSCSSIVSSQAETEKYIPIPVSSEHLTTSTGMGTVVRAMQRPESGLEVRDRLWLKITIPNAFLGSDAVDWLFGNVQGFEDRREARKFAGHMLKAGFIKQAVNKTTFSEQCYYSFGDESTIASGLANVSLKENHPPTSSGLPPPTGPAPPVPWVPTSAGAVQPHWNPEWSGPQPHQQHLQPVQPQHYGLDQTGTTSIYNPSAPPPSANYMQMPGYPVGGKSSVASGYNSLEGSHNLRLAGSGSGSESDKVPSTAGGASSVTDGGFLAAISARKAQSHVLGPASSFGSAQPAYQAHC